MQPFSTSASANFDRSQLMKNGEWKRDTSHPVHQNSCCLMNMGCGLQKFRAVVSSEHGMFTEVMVTSMEPKKENARRIFAFADTVRAP